jgi:DNA-binding SARP family transcriptional activator
MITIEPPPVAICLLGRFRVFKRGVPVEVRPGGKTERLLSHLALEQHHRVSRDWLLEALWPDIDVSQAAHALNSLMHTTRKLLGDVLEGAALLVYTAGAYQLNTDAGVAIDFEGFDASVDRAERDFQAGDAAASLRHSLDAIDRYGGDLCAVESVRGLVERERLRARFLSVLVRVADHYFQEKSYRTALTYALRLLSHDPCREDAHRLVMRCHVRLGERAQAFRQYQTCRRLLRDEFGAHPELLTVELFDQVRTVPESV